MSESADPTPVSEPAAVPLSPIALNGLNVTVQNCCNAYNKALIAERSKGVKGHEAREKAVEKYRDQMPYLSSQANIRGYIACVAHAMLIDIIRKDDGTKLLYAAQIALAALPREVRSAGRRKAEECLPEN
ncbi:MAG TPA: hypothetical protein VG225_04835 [Terracidiphilus sp.]|jgi:hypothetical protein|nr:hypothetical protein [Terracidiphilus sp.]